MVQGQGERHRSRLPGREDNAKGMKHSASSRLREYYADRTTPRPPSRLQWPRVGVTFGLSGPCLTSASARFPAAQVRRAACSHAWPLLALFLSPHLVEHPDLGGLGRRRREATARRTQALLVAGVLVVVLAGPTGFCWGAGVWYVPRPADV